MNRPSQSANRGINRVRISGGVWRGRVVNFPDVAGLRPTGDRIKQTVFNWLGQNLHGKVCLDAYAGSGALGFEAASRGAERVVLCEVDAGAVRRLKENALALKAGQCEVVARDVKSWLASNLHKFDVVFCDPPFALAEQSRFLAAIVPHLAADAVIYVESNTALEGLVGGASAFDIAKQGKAGAVYFGLLRLNTAR